MTGSRSLAMLLTLVGALCPSAALADRGGPDAAGYTYVDSTEADGPTFAWVDLVGTGTQVTGLADDNAAASPIALGASFPYYGATYTSVKIGSNGWVSFTNVSNVASCFPTIPSAGGPADEYVAALMGDLNFTGAGNPGAVYTLRDEANHRFVISYVSVPFWTVSARAGRGPTASSSCSTTTARSSCSTSRSRASRTTRRATTSRSASRARAARPA